MENLRLKKSILEVVDNQLRDNNPPMVREAYDKLIAEGYSFREAKEKIGAVVLEEIYDIMKENHITEGPVLDLGCGTGELTRRMAVSGYDLTGVDSSLEMLQIAQEKQTEQGILYLLQEMQELELDGCVYSGESISGAGWHFSV